MMITQLGLVFLVLVSFEIIKFFNLKKLFKENVDSYKNLIKNFLNNQLDDQTKQQQIIKSSKNLLSISFKIFLCIGLILFLICERTTFYLTVLRVHDWGVGKKVVF